MRNVGRERSDVIDGLSYLPTYLPSVFRSYWRQMHTYIHTYIPTGLMCLNRLYQDPGPTVQREKQTNLDMLVDIKRASEAQRVDLETIR